jgi:beta propeller repeat protein
MRVRIALVALLATVSTLAVASQAQAAGSLSGTETRVTTDPGDQYDPAISGNIVVFTDYRNADTDVYYVDLATGVEHSVIVAPGNQELTGVSGSRIVYTDYRTADVVLFDIATGTTTNLTRADKDAAGRAFSSIDPAISGDLVAWQDSRDGNQEIYAMNLATGEERRVTDSVDIDSKPSVSGTLIVWQRCAAGGTCDIWAYDWATGATTQITDTPASNERNPNIVGTKIVYQDDRTGTSDIDLYDLVTGIEQHLTLAGDQANPHVSGEFVSMDDLSGGLYHIKLWHYPTDEVFDVTGGTAGQYLSDIDGNRVVYTDDRNGDLEIYMTTFQYQQSGDTTPPVIVVPAAVAVNATGPGGALAGYTVTATDDTDPAPALSCAPASGSLFAIGDTTVACTATDSSGNTATASFTVHVAGAAEQLAALRSHVASLGLRRLVAATLDAELQLARTALAAGHPKVACTWLAVFELEVRLLPPSVIAAHDVTDLVASERQIRAVLGC